MITENMNERHIKALNSAYINHQLIVFYGAGLSKPLGFPDWQELIDNILEQYLENEKENKQRKEIREEIGKLDFWKAMSHIKKKLHISEDSLKETIAAIIAGNEQLNCPKTQEWEDNNYKDLAQLDIDLFITTNYDKIFPLSLKGYCEKIDFIKSRRSFVEQLNTSGVDKKIIYLHGRAEEPKSIIISENDVKKVYGSPKWSNAFSTVLNSYKILFVGVSFEDNYLRDFLEEKLELNRNACYAIMLKRISRKKCPCNQIIVGAETPVVKIREIFKEISKEIENIIFLRFKLKADGKRKIESHLKRSLDIFRNIEVKEEKGYTLFIFQTYKANKSLKAVCSLIKEIVADLEKEGVIQPSGYVCFISRNKKNVSPTIGSIGTAFKRNAIKFLTELVTSESCGVVIDKISLDLCMTEDSEWIQEFCDRKGNIIGKNKEYSVHIEDGIKILGAKNSETEVHVAGLIFCQNKILLEKRKLNEANVPDMYSLPGGRLKKEEGFREGLKRILDEKYNIQTDNLDIVDEYKVYDANIPGLALASTIKKYPESSLIKFFDYKQLCSLPENQLACKKQLIDEAFALMNKTRESVKLRIIMLTDCIYNCRCCHHENIKEEFQGSRLKSIEKSLKVIRNNFNVEKVTITGGEPLVSKNRKNLCQLLEYIRNFWPFVDLSVITNAYYLDKKCIEELNRFRVRYKISIYGYDNESFKEYARPKGELIKEKFDYIEDIKSKIKMLHENACLVTLNIPMNRRILPGIRGLLFDSDFQDILHTTKTKIKFIEMVRPRRDSSHFDENYVSEKEGIKQIGGAKKTGDKNWTPFSNTQAFSNNGLEYFVYEYPCKNPENCKSCFNNFALTMKPDGTMLICKKALKYVKTAEVIFMQSGIKVEDVDLGKEYE